MSDQYSFRTGLGGAGIVMLFSAFALFFVAYKQFNPAAVILGFVVLCFAVDALWFEYTRYRAYKQLNNSKCSLES